MPNLCRHHPQRLRRQRGAALLLLLLTVAMGVSSVLILAFNKTASDQQRVADTTRTLGQASEALIGFALQHGRLPRPAVSATDGRESQVACRSDADCTGFLPWIALGVAPADSWGHLLRYSVTPAFTSAPIERNEIRASKTIQTRDADGRLRYTVGTTICGRGDCTPAVVFSSGKEGYATSTSGVAQAVPEYGHADEKTNHLAAQNFIIRQPPKAEADTDGFDDLVAYVPLPVLLTRMLIANKID
jgi:hypothetical protein